MKLRNLILATGAALSLPFAGTAYAQVLIDDFSGDLSAYTATRILTADGNATDNVYSWNTDGGTLNLETTSFDGIEQFALTRTDFTLDVGSELIADFNASYTDSQDIGLYVGAGHPTADVREDYIAIYMRNNGQIFSRGFNGSSELGLSGGGFPATTQIFIARTAENTFETGYYEGEVRTVLVTRIMDNTDIGSAIGAYADIRGAGSVGSLDNLSIIPEPSTYALLFGAVGLAFAAYRRRRKA